MTTLKLKFAVILLVFFAMTSCQKENMKELNSTIDTTSQRISKSQHTVNEAATTEFTKELKKAQANSRVKSIAVIECSDMPIFDTNAGQNNTFHTNNSPCASASLDNFNGEDNAYLFFAEDDPQAITSYHINLADLQNDLDLFVYTLDEYGNIKDCKATSISIGLGNETIELSNLREGFYLIVVDGWMRGVTSSYSLDFYCTAVSANPPSIALIDINKVEVGNNNNFTATMQQVSATQWTETQFNGSIFHFTEVSRDEWSVYLRDDSRGINLQLDIHRNKVVYSDDIGNNFDLYDIYNSSNKVSGYLVKNISYGISANNKLGEFSLTSGTDWVEVPTDPLLLSNFYTEFGKDYSNIYLRDNTLGADVHIDLTQLKITYYYDQGGQYQTTILNAY